MNSDEIYKGIGYLAVIFLGLYLVVKSLQFQTNLVLEGFSKTTTTTTSKKNACGNNIKPVSKEGKTALIDSVKTSSKGLNELNCKELGSSPEFSDSEVSDALNILFDTAITNRKILAIGNGYFGILGMNRAHPDANDPALTRLIAYVEQVRALEESKRYYNELFGNKE